MKISIAMATYNGAAYLPEQLASFIDQSRRPDELVITDDQSSDQTVGILRDFGRTAPFPVRIEVNPRNVGVTQNFSRALALCTGDLVMLSDQDDVWLPEKIGLLEQAARQHPRRSCFLNDALLADAALRPVGTTKLGQIRAAGLPDTALVMGCCAAFRRDLLDCLLPVPDSQPAHDNWLVQVADLLGQTVRLDQPAQYYRRHGKNVSDFHVNRLTRPTPLEQLRERVGALARHARSSGGFDRELQFLQDAAQRLAERGPAIDALVGAADAAQARTAVRARADLLSRRRSIRALPRPRRVRQVWSLWREGGYRQSGRLQGAVKDLLIAGAPPGQGDA